ncbi:MAG: alpha/beta hydrolase [Pseudomonadota bacterium]
MATAFTEITDWDDAYANAPYIPGSDGFPERRAAKAAACRDGLIAKGRAELDIAYGPHDRQRYDLFRPEAAPKGTLVFVHGGYWLRFDKSFWSNLAEGGLSAGYAVAMPSYPLAPEASIPEITASIGKAIEGVAGSTDGPILLAGHSAGGHLVSRMMCQTSPLRPQVKERITRVVSISGVHDLRPLMKTAMSADLQLDTDVCTAESPALLMPEPGLEIVCWVGADERPEFVRQNALLANAWTGLGAKTMTVEEPGRHHLDVIDGLEDANSGLMHAVLGLH